MAWTGLADSAWSPVETYYIWQPWQKTAQDIYWSRHAAWWETRVVNGFGEILTTLSFMWLHASLFCIQSALFATAPRCGHTEPSDCSNLLKPKSPIQYWLPATWLPGGPLRQGVGHNWYRKDDIVIQFFGGFYHLLFASLAVYFSLSSYSVFFLIGVWDESTAKIN